MTYAKIILIGNVGHDPSRSNNNYPDFSIFSLAVGKKIKKQDGSEENKTTWYKIFTFRKYLSDTLTAYVKKGDKIYCEGEPAIKTWQNQNTGEHQSQIEVNLEAVRLLGKREKEENTTTDSTRAAKLDEEIPF